MRRMETFLRRRDTSGPHFRRPVCAAQAPGSRRVEDDHFRSRSLRTIEAGLRRGVTVFAGEAFEKLLARRAVEPPSQLQQE